MSHPAPVRILTGLVVAGASVAALAGCATEPPAALPRSAAPTSTPTAAPWSYAGADGPAHWGEIADACEATATSQQSPIDIDTPTLVQKATLSAADVHYKASSFTLENTGHTIEAVPDDTTANWIELDGTKFYLQQFHFHVSSEHTVDGVGTQAELHLVNKSDDGQIAVLGVLLTVGGDNPTLDSVLASVPTNVTSADKGEIRLDAIDPSTLVPTNSEIARYDGSLTTPPCTEGVHWSVYLSPLTIGQAQFDALTTAYSDNHRPTQNLDGREVDEVRD